MVDGIGSGPKGPRAPIGDFLRGDGEDREMPTPNRVTPGSLCWLQILESDPEDDNEEVLVWVLGRMSTPIYCDNCGEVYMIAVREDTGEMDLYELEDIRFCRDKPISFPVDKPAEPHGEATLHDDEDPAAS